jgi:L-cysteine:1D-myo-inositol 2-amino-2-deoxy-alpha-D-glucopyranoside ligase
MVRHQGEKMSKSLGNLVMARELLQAGWPADALRAYISTHHYREPWSYSEVDLATAGAIANALTVAVTATGGEGKALGSESSRVAFCNAMENDLDSPSALRILAQLAEHIMDSSRAGWNVLEAQATLRSCSAVLGLRLDKDRPEDRVATGWNEHKRRFS